MPFLPEQTIPYKTFVKTKIVQALRNVFSIHPDNFLAKAKITIEYPNTQNDYPAIVVKFYERTIKNAGVGHMEWILEDNSTIQDEFKHYFYDGDVEFVIYALSSKDRDLMSDALVQTICFADRAPYTDLFVEKLYADSSSQDLWNYINVNTDTISPFGETQIQQPWLSEDQLIYQTSYRVSIFGEFYSLPPISESFGPISSVNIYPYAPGDPIPEGAGGNNPWQ